MKNNQENHDDDECIAMECGGTAPPTITVNECDEAKHEPRNSRRHLIRRIVVLFGVAMVVLSIVVTLNVLSKQEQHANSHGAHASSRQISSTVGLSDQLLSRTYDVVYMSRQLYLDDPTTVLGPGAVVYTDEPDRALWIKKDDTCFAIFRAVTPTLDDWLQSLPFGTPVQFESPLGKTCTAMEGYYHAYFDTNFVDQFRSDVHDCVSSCDDGDCVLVIGGSSQGAGIAAVAAVDMEDLNPMLITAGQPPVLIDTEDEGPCTAIDSNRYFRFVNTAMVSTRFSSEPRLHYDLVPSLSLTDGNDTMGNLIILSDNEGGVAEYPDHVRPSILPTMWNQESHFIVNYLPRLEAMRNSSVFPIPTDGWIDGSSCNFDVECQSDLCYDYKCISPGSNGAPCNDNSGCSSGRCDGLFTFTCRPKLGGGSWCNEDSDCLSDKCFFGKCKS